MANCKTCGTPIVLIPSAKERSEKYGHSPSYYTNLFRTCTDCIMKGRHPKLKTTPSPLRFGESLPHYIQRIVV